MESTIIIINDGDKTPYHVRVSDNFGIYINDQILDITPKEQFDDTQRDMYNLYQQTLPEHLALLRAGLMYSYPDDLSDQMEFEVFDFVIMYLINKTQLLDPIILKYPYVIYQNKKLEMPTVGSDYEDFDIVAEMKKLDILL